MKNEKVVFIQRINNDFYEVYNDDAYVIANLMGYKLVLEYKDLIKTGFPEDILDKVIGMLRKNRVSFSVSDDDSLFFDFKEKNKYDHFLKEDVPVERVYKLYVPKYSGKFEVLFEDDSESEKFTVGENIDLDAELVEKVYKNDVGKVVVLDSGISFKILSKDMKLK